jgi:hypothetical protein
VRTLTQKTIFSKLKLRKLLPLFATGSNQMEHGSYGTLPFHQWIDNFHTGFNLECIYEYKKLTGDDSFEMNLQKGIAFLPGKFFYKRRSQ